MAKQQWQLALDYMQKKPLTSLTALTELGIISFPKRICEIVKHGHNVKKTRITVIDRFGNPKSVIEYSLVD